MLILDSVIWLAIAVAVKSVSFAFLEPRLSRSKALSFMLAANILSTIPGLLAAVFAGASTLFAIPVIFGLGWLAQRRLSNLPGVSQNRWLTRGGIAFAFTGTFFGSIVMFIMAEGALDGRQFATYWLLRLIFTGTAVCLGMGISAVLEEYAIAGLARKAQAQVSFYTSVIRANYITLGLVLLVAAGHMLPRRLHAPHFLVSWFETFSHLLGQI